MLTQLFLLLVWPFSVLKCSDSLMLRLCIDPWLEKIERRHPAVLSIFSGSHVTVLSGYSLNYKRTRMEQFLSLKGPLSGNLYDKGRAQGIHSSFGFVHPLESLGGILLTRCFLPCFICFSKIFQAIKFYILDWLVWVPG